ncbi:hypothetical protein H5410_049107 [Solanum commersonii]|uniref:Uncharacterized protein n=1 Tax=Solanum commersonii TaxID=4109 RepID=A0A9J5XK56_SOLCO|nr:hypothetical protein H5410_049107 [Solanum commersonii]
MIDFETEDLVSVGSIYIGSIEKSDAGVNGVVDELDHIGFGFGRPSSNVLIEVFNLSGARDGAHVVSLVVHPGQRELRGALSHFTELWKRETNRYFNGHACINPVLVVQVYAINIKSL